MAVKVTVDPEVAQKVDKNGDGQIQFDEFKAKSSADAEQAASKAAAKQAALKSLLAQSTEEQRRRLALAAAARG